MSLHVIDLLSDALKHANKTIKNSTILLLGISYKADVKDIQLSPAEQLVKKLEELGARIKIYDPYFKSTKVYGVDTENDLVNSISDIDGVIIVTPHKEFLDLEPTFFSSKVKNLAMIDSRGILDKYAAKKAGLIFRGLGRGKS
jgi:UDP-N-acetyl-D-mannosaminuronate dehydrogenase